MPYIETINIRNLEEIALSHHDIPDVRIDVSNVDSAKKQWREYTNEVIIQYGLEEASN